MFIVKYRFNLSRNILKSSSILKSPQKSVFLFSTLQRSSISTPIPHFNQSLWSYSLKANQRVPHSTLSSKLLFVRNFSDQSKNSENSENSSKTEGNSSKTDSHNNETFNKSQTSVPPPKKKKPQTPVTWKSLTIATIIGGLIIAYYQLIKQKKDEEIKEKTNQAFGVARVGGPWTLVNHNGIPLTDNEFKGLFQFIYFGFTNCPDICPTELTKMANILTALDKEGLGDLIQPIFITIDPYRDTIGSVREYIKDFHPRLMGFTGTPAQIEKICKMFRVYHSKPKTGEGDDDYLVDHSIILYLMDTNGKFLDFYGTNLEEEDVTNKIKQHIEKHFQSFKSNKSAS